jgi:putative DNA primase/helicase
LEKVLKSAATVAAVERLARADRRLAARADQFDADPMTIGTPEGLLDLRTGEVRPATSVDYISKITSVGLGDRCDRWLQFLHEITAGDAELQGFLARVVGYALTGSTREQSLFFLYGPQANGKTTFIETIARLFNDYAVSAPVEMFALNRFSGHTTDIAGLQGARLVSASETEAGRALAEARIKLLTGGDRVSARRMRADNVTFQPQFKLFITGNHKPRIQSSDEAIKRRIMLVPFNVVFGPERRDRDLPEKLRAELPGILRWAVEGCLEWQRIGLSPPATVLDATRDYLEAEDTVSAWITEELDLHPQAMTATRDLFASWSAYATMSNEHIGTQKDLVDALQKKGFILKKGRQSNRWIGIRVREKLQ